MVPLIRPEIPGYVLMPTMAQQMGVMSIGTFHKRWGDQILLTNNGSLSGAWMRVFGEARKQQWGSRVAGLNYELAPKFDGHLWGVQFGLDLMAGENSWGQHRLGLFYSHAEASGTVFGNTLAINTNRSGRLSLQGDSIGGYLTQVGHGGWYVDAVAMYTWLDGKASSYGGVGAGTSGNSVTVSLESGLPFAISGSWTLEPQAQLIWQHIDFDDTQDPYSSIDYRALNALTGRLGLRLEGNMTINGMPLQSFVSADLWHDFAQNSNVVFNDRNVATAIGGTALELRSGLSVKLTSNVSAYGSVGYTTNLDEEKRKSFSGNLGVRVKW